MSFTGSIQKLSLVTRSTDWRLSFVPFIIGCVYLWIYIFNVPLESGSLKLFFFSLMTTFGFASLGYFINEFFDKKTDKAAGKINKLSLLKPGQQFFLFVSCLLITFVPWLWLPADSITWLLISAELILFLLYSLPFPRLKSVPYLSGFVDSFYAYVVPLTLSFYTYRLYSGAELHGFIFLFAAAVFFIGYRNITVHHINDIFKDKLSGNVTLPQKAGVFKTNLVVILSLLYEVFFIILFSLYLSFESPLFTLWILFYVVFIFVRTVKLKININYIVIEPVRQITDPAYQIIFPLFTIFLLIVSDWKWLILLPAHILILTPLYIFKPLINLFKWLYLNTVIIFSVYVRAFLSATVNYPIYFLFLLFRIDLKKENKSAIEYLKHKIRK